MSKQALGTLVRNAPSQIVATFVVEGSQLVYTANLTSSSLQPFTSANATLSYTNKSDLAGTHAVSGKIGTVNFKITFDNGVTITGALNPPLFSSEKELSGSGAWTTY